MAGTLLLILYGLGILIVGAAIVIGACLFAAAHRHSKVRDLNAGLAEALYQHRRWVFVYFALAAAFICLMALGALLQRQ